MVKYHLHISANYQAEYKKSKYISQLHEFKFSKLRDTLFYRDT
jgi:hypothetical protein